MFSSIKNLGKEPLMSSKVNQLILEMFPLNIYGKSPHELRRKIHKHSQVFPDSGQTSMMNQITFNTWGFSLLYLLHYVYNDRIYRVPSGYIIRRFDPFLSLRGEFCCWSSTMSFEKTSADNSCLPHDEPGLNPGLDELYHSLLTARPETMLRII